MFERNISGVTIECRQGDIANQPDVDVVVNAANPDLKPGGGVAGAIHRAAGPGLEIECRPLAPIKPGQAVITRAHGLPNKHVVHCLGPVYGRDEPASDLLTSCYDAAIRLAEARRLRSIAFPSVSTGVFGYPVTEAARVAMRAVMEAASGLTSLRLIRFVLFSASDLEVYETALADWSTANSKE